MELYGKGYRLAPDGGIGLTLYSGLDYLEYYSQLDKCVVRNGDGRNPAAGGSR